LTHPRVELNREHLRESNMRLMKFPSPGQS
jgi:hypothetical protein